MAKERESMKRRICAVLVLVSLALSLMIAQKKETPKDDGTQREKFDPQRDAEKDLQAAVVLAAKSHQRILLDVGGEWCSWCHKLDKFFQDNKDVSEFLHINFIVVKINYSKENKNEKFLSKYPEVKGYPHLFVLDGNGKLLHSQDTGDLESGDHHDHDKVFNFLKKWAPKIDS
jgi:thioredoxin-related protein